MACQGRIEGVHRIAAGTPHVVKLDGSKGKPVYRVGGKSFVFSRNDH